MADNPGEELEDSIEANPVPNTNPGVAVAGEVVEVLPPNGNLPVGGRLFHFRKKWTFSPWAYSVVSKGLGWQWLETPPRLRQFFQPPTPFLTEYVQELLDKSVVKKAKSLKFQGRLFCVPKKDTDKKRVILDLSKLNLFIRCCLLYTSPSPRDGLLSRMPSSA